MERLTPQQRLQIVQLYYENQRSVRNVFRAIRGTYDADNRPTEITIANTIRKFKSQFILVDDTPLVRLHPARSEENIAAVAESVRKDPDESIRHRSQQLGLFYSEWALEKLMGNLVFYREILFNDEAYFWLNVHVNNGKV